MVEVVAIMGTKPEFLVTKNEMLVVLVTGLVAWLLKFYAFLWAWTTL